MRVAVLGAGSGGLSAVVELTQAGHDVRLWNRRAATLAPHLARGAVRHTGVLGNGSVVPERMSTDLAAVLDGVEVAVVCLPSVVHGEVFGDLAGLGCRVPVVLNPGHTGGALHARAVFAERSVPLPPVVEFSTLTYVARTRPDGTVATTGRAHRVRAGALPDGHAALSWGVRLFPAAEPVADVVASSLSNVNFVLHPPGALLGASWVEATGGDFLFYVDGITPGVGRVLDALDAERRRVAAAYGHDLPTLLQEMAGIGTVDPGTAARGDTVAAIRAGAANREIRAPDSLAHRYYVEDLAFGLVPFLVLAEICGVQAEVAASLLRLGSTVLGRDLGYAGLNRSRLGLTGLDLAAVRTLVQGQAA
ncbi:MAG: NAD/NADP octopine/nopaline dehydrogenase family protein [Marmoricola sp.]|jgi:opine dehydrogenase